MSSWQKTIAYPIWRRLPARPRQRLANAMFNLMRPRLSPSAIDLPTQSDLPVVIVGFLSSPSGLGQSARLAAEALKRDGRKVYGIDLGHRFFEVTNLISHGLPDGKTLAGPAHVIVNINAPYMPYVLSLLGKSFVRDKHVTGYWAWELPEVPETWRRGIDCVHDIAVPSHFVARALEKFGTDKPIAVVPHPVALDFPTGASLTDSAEADRPFTVVASLSVTSGFTRKNPLGMIRAFRQAFADDPDCRLKLHVTNVEGYAPARSLILAAIGGAPTIEVSWAARTRENLWQWWGTPDACLSLHRAEGFGLIPAEAMCLGCPTVATGWSGNMDFMSDDTSFLVRYRLVDVLDPQGKYAAGSGQWAEPDIDHAAELLQTLRQNPALARQKAARARAAAHVRLGAAQFCENLRALSAVPSRATGAHGDNARGGLHEPSSSSL